MRRKFVINFTVSGICCDSHGHLLGWFETAEMSYRSVSIFTSDESGSDLAFVLLRNLIPPVILKFLIPSSSFSHAVGMAFRKFGVTAVGTILGGTFATYALRRDEEVLARVEMEGKPIKRARKLPMRNDQLQALQSGEEYDVLIIGGGATGAGCALDACTRGLKTALVEANDFASGTSSRSTKLIHGGVRYLQKAILGVSWMLAMQVWS